MSCILLTIIADLALHEDECSVEAVTVEDCQSEVSTRYSLQRILNAQQKLKEMEVAQRKLERLTPAWYDDYVSFYHQ